MRMETNMRVKSQMDKKTEKGLILRKMELSQRGNGSTIKDMGEQ